MAPSLTSTILLYLVQLDFRIDLADNWDFVYGPAQPQLVLSLVSLACLKMSAKSVSRIMEEVRHVVDKSGHNEIVTA